MNNIFDIRRFGKYLVYDLNGAKNRYGVSLLIMGLLPLICLVFQQLVSLVFMGELAEPSIINKAIAVCGAVFATVLTFPSKVYGGVTEKKFGSSWTLIPASSFEKWLSVAVVSCVILPICLALLLLATDTVLGLVVPKLYGASVIKDGIDFLNNNLHTEFMDIRFGYAGYASWCENILAFTLGAMVFKKAKVGKTILAIILVSSVFGSVLGTLLPKMDIQDIVSTVDPQKAVEWVNIYINAVYAVVFAALLGGLYYRIRTIKH